jgi:hypothetical protein
LSDPSIYRTSPATNISSLFAAPSRRKISSPRAITGLTLWSLFDHCKKKTHLGLGFADRARVVAPLERRCSTAAHATLAAFSRRTAASNDRRASVAACVSPHRRRPRAAESASPTGHHDATRRRRCDAPMPRQPRDGAPPARARRLLRLSLRPRSEPDAAPTRTFLLHWLPASVN